MMRLITWVAQAATHELLNRQLVGLAPSRFALIGLGLGTGVSMAAASMPEKDASPQGKVRNAFVRFVVTGDTRGDSGANPINSEILGEIVQATISEGADFILIPGDLVYGSADRDTLVSQLSEWLDIMQPLYDAGIGVYPCRGNHDIGSKAGWDDVFSGGRALPGNGPIGEENITFSFTHAGVTVIALDQYGNHPHRVNQSWLDAQLSVSAQPHVFVFGHEPAFKVYHSDCLDDYPSDRNTFWSSIAAAGGRVYFCGHDHMYDDARIDDGNSNHEDDLHQFVVGTGGGPLYDWNGEHDGDNGPWTPELVYHEKEYGYLLVEVDGLSVTVTWKHRIAQGVYRAAGDVFVYTIAGCTEDVDCDNGLFCDGVETCQPDDAEADWRGCVAGVSGCEWCCNEETDTCAGCCVASSWPPNCAVDARYPTGLNDGCRTRFGFDAVNVAFNCDPSQAVPTDLSEYRVTGIGAPDVLSVRQVGATNSVVIELDRPIPVGQWTCIEHIESGSKTCLGYLPADVNGDLAATPVDILRIIDDLNEVVLPSLESWQCDVDRSGRCAPADILAVINLLNGVECFHMWLGQRLPDCPSIR
jgi:hypothetical protein